MSDILLCETAEGERERLNVSGRDGKSVHD